LKQSKCNEEGTHPTLRALPIQLTQHNYSNADSGQELWFQRAIPEPLKTKGGSLPYS